MAKRETTANRPWQRMLSGRRLDLLDPSPLDIEIDDIAHGLARVARWNGQTAGAHAFSVAQHTLMVDDILAKIAPEVGATGRLAGLLHDAPEYVIGDLISPFKATARRRLSRGRSAAAGGDPHALRIAGNARRRRLRQRSRRPTASPPTTKRSTSRASRKPRRCAISGGRETAKATAFRRARSIFRRGRLRSRNGGF